MYKNFKFLSLLVWKFRNSINITLHSTTRILDKLLPQTEIKSKQQRTLVTLQLNKTSRIQLVTFNPIAVISIGTLLRGAKWLREYGNPAQRDQKGFLPTCEHINGHIDLGARWDSAWVNSSLCYDPDFSEK